MKSKWIPEDDYMKIVDHLADRDRKIVRLLRLTGYRVDDLLYSRIWEWETPQAVTLRESKTGKSRTIKKTPAVELIVDSLAGERSRLSYLVPTRRRNRRQRRKIHRTTLWRHFQAAVKQAGLDGKGYTIHSLRKCYAVDRLRASRSFEAVQQDLGHKYLSTTLLYVQDALQLK